METHARQLERELAEVTKQRDHYKKACNQYSEDEMLCKLHEVTKQRDEANIKRDEIFQALNKERQWMHEKMEAIRETMKTVNQLIK
jgi:uncharacterized coiled-coil DUF342 family protein